MLKQRKSLIELILIILFLLILISLTPKQNLSSLTGKTDEGTSGGEGACTPKTCLQLGKECGSWDNGCGNLIWCGTCSSGKTCSNGKCVTITTYTPTQPSTQPAGTGCATLGDYECCNINTHHCTYGGLYRPALCAEGLCCPTGYCEAGGTCANSVMPCRSTYVGSLCNVIRVGAISGLSLKGTCTFQPGGRFCNCKCESSSKQCISNDKIASCVNGNWEISVTCPSDTSCQQIGTNSVCKPTAPLQPQIYTAGAACSPEGDEKCATNGMSKLKCLNGEWVSFACTVAGCNPATHECYSPVPPADLRCESGEVLSFDKVTKEWDCLPEEKECNLGEKKCIDASRLGICILDPEYGVETWDAQWCSEGCNFDTKTCRGEKVEIITCTNDEFCSTSTTPAFGGDCPEPGRCVECAVDTDCLLKKCSSSQKCRCKNGKCLEIECETNSDCYKMWEVQQQPEKVFECINYKCVSREPELKEQGVGVFGRIFNWLFSWYD